MQTARTAALALALAFGVSGCALIDAIGGDGDKSDGGGGDDDGGGGDGDGGLQFEKAQLWAAHPPIVQSGAAVRLEGEFLAESTMVKFEGTTVEQPANVLGVARAEVGTASIPFFTGSISVLVHPLTSELVSFRVTPFQLGLSRLQDHYPQTGGARTMPVLDAPRSRHTAHVMGRYVYVFGGDDRNQNARARINADGTLGTFATDAGNLMQGRSGHMSVRVGSWFYVLGGSAGGTSLSTVEQAGVDGFTGEPGGFSPYRESLHRTRAGAALAVVGSYLYVVGGRDSGSGVPLASVERAVIARGGELDPFEELANPALKTPRSEHTALVIGDYLYVIGGRDGNGPLTSVERAKISPHGDLEPFEHFQDLAEARESHASVVLAPHLYVLGGSGAEELDTVEVAPIFDHGEIGSFSDAGFTLPGPRAGASAVVAGNDLYLVGGTIPGDAGSTATIARGPVIRDGQLGTAATQWSNSLDQPRTGAVVASDWDKVYVFGGDKDGDDFVEHNDVKPDGTLASHFQQNGQWDNARSGACAAVLGNMIYFIGGENGVGAASALVDWANFNGNFATPIHVSTYELTTARKDLGCVAVGGYLYAIGGRGATALGSVERAPFAPGGEQTGEFTTVAGVNLETPRSGHSVAVLRDKVYVFGGTDAGGATLQSIEVATIADGSLTDFSLAGEDMAVPQTRAAAAVVGRFLYMIGGASAGTPLDTAQTVTIDGNGELSGPATPPANLEVPCEAPAGILLGNFLWIVGGSNAGAPITTVQAASFNEAE